MAVGAGLGWFGVAICAAGPVAAAPPPARPRPAAPPEASAAGAAEPVEYRLAPVFERGALAAVAVEMRLRADPSGRTVIELPDSYGGVKDHWRYLSPIEASGATVAAPAPAERVLRSRPGARITLRYRVRTAYPRDPDAAGGNPYEGAAVRPAWFAGLGEFLFATPKGGEAMPARFAWDRWPARWTRVSSLDGRAATVADVAEANFLAGPAVELRTRPIRGGRLRLASLGPFAWGADAYADRVAAVVDAQRRFWNEADGDYTVTLFRLAPSPGSSSFGGTGRSRGFVQYASPDATPDATPDALFRLIAHEHQHNWIARRVGAPPVDGASAFWFSEGFTDFYTARTLLRAGLWTPAQFAADLDRALLAAASSPARAYPNSRISADFWTDPAVGQLPYDRGHLFAHLLDAELRRAGGPGLDAVLFEMRDRWAAAAAKPELIANLLAVLDARGFDARPLIARHIDAGEPIPLPADLFGPCATLEATSLPVFDPGFDRDASAKAGRFTGVDPAGAAHAAGLRDGMARVARLGGEEGDARVPLRYRVRDARGDEREIAWLPAGRARFRAAQVRLTGAADPARLAECRARMSGAR